MTTVSVSGPVKAVAFLVFVAAIAGATWGVQAVVGEDLSLSALGASPVRSTLNATEGHTVTFALTLQNRADVELPVVVKLSGDGLSGQTSLVSVPASGSRTVFVPVAVPEGTSVGDHALDLQVVTEAGEVAREKSAAATLRVLPPTEDGFGDGDAADVVYVGRLTSSGLAFNSNDPLLLGLPFAKTDTYRDSNGRFTVVQGRAIEGFYNGLRGMQTGESRTITIAAEDAYGAAVVESEKPRRDVLDATEEIGREQQVGRSAFDQFITGTQQGEPSDYEAGDEFFVTDGPNRWRYVIDTIDEANVAFHLDVEVGQTYTIHPFWPNATVVESVNVTHAVLRTTPPTSEGDAFTYRSYWPEMSVVESVNETSIVVRHDLTEGLKYAEPQAGGAPAVQYTVLAVEEDAIHVSSPNTHPLGGEDLTFDVLVLELRKG